MTQEQIQVILINKEKNESAQMFRNVTLRMKLAIANKQEFVFHKEAGDIWDRTDMMPQWLDLHLFYRGFSFDEVDQDFC